MRITELRLHPVASQREYTTTIAKPGKQLSGGVETSYYLILEVETDQGFTGYGEGSDINRLPDIEAAEARLRDRLVGQRVFDTEAIMQSLDEPSYLQCAVDLALHDLMGKQLDLPVCDLLGGRVHQPILASWVIYIRGADRLEEELAPKLELGIRAFKMKVGADLDLDEERVRRVRELAGDDAEIKVDANGAWDVPGAVEAINRLARYNIAGVETPIPADDVDAMLAVKGQIDVPYIEHGGTSKRHLDMVARGAVDAFKVSVCSGGLLQAKRIAAMASMGGVACYVGSTVEMGPGTAAGIHFAVSTPNTEAYGADLRGPLLLKDDVLSSPIHYEDGYLHLPEGPGLGVEVDPQRLQDLRFDPAGAA